MVLGIVRVLQRGERQGASQNVACLGYASKYHGVLYRCTPKYKYEKPIFHARCVSSPMLLNYPPLIDIVKYASCSLSLRKIVAILSISIYVSFR
jgi:hypothetical protein